MSTALMYALLAFYGAIGLASAWERNWPRTWYWIGAMIIVAATSKMK